MKSLTEFSRRTLSKDGLTSRCKKCISDAGKDYRAKHSERIKQNKRKYYENNREKILIKDKKHREENREERNALQNKRYHENRDSILQRRRERDKANIEKIREQRRKYYWRNREKALLAGKARRQRAAAKVRAANAYRRARKSNATPSWLTPQHFKEIGLMHKLARKLEIDTNTKYHVDHIHPLNGKNSCGLHVPWNLQVIPATINIAKNNNILPELGLTAV